MHEPCIEFIDPSEGGKVNMHRPIRFSAMKGNRLLRFVLSPQFRASELRSLMRRTAVGSRYKPLGGLRGSTPLD